MNYQNEEEFTKLADDLEKRWYKRPHAMSPLEEQVIIRLRENQYHDFGSESATPKLLMIDDFTKLEMPAVVERIKNGDFDQ